MSSFVRLKLFYWNRSNKMPSVTSTWTPSGKEINSNVVMVTALNRMISKQLPTVKSFTGSVFKDLRFLDDINLLNDEVWSSHTLNELLSQAVIKSIPVETRGAKKAQRFFYCDIFLCLCRKKLTKQSLDVFLKSRYTSFIFRIKCFLFFRDSIKKNSVLTL